MREEYPEHYRGLNGRTEKLTSVQVDQKRNMVFNLCCKLDGMTLSTSCSCLTKHIIPSFQHSHTQVLHSLGRLTRLLRNRDLDLHTSLNVNNDLLHDLRRRIQTITPISATASSVYANTAKPPKRLTRSSACGSSSQTYPTSYFPHHKASSWS